MMSISMYVWCLILSIADPSHDFEFQQTMVFNEPIALSELPLQDTDTLYAKVISAATTEAMTYVNNHSEYGIVFGERSLSSDETAAVKRYLKGKSYGPNFKILSENERFELRAKTLRISYNDSIEYGPLVGFHVNDGQLTLVQFTNKPTVLYTAAFSEKAINFTEIQARLRTIYADGIKKAFTAFYNN